MKVLAACEFSGKVRDSFRARGHDAWSRDLLPSDTGQQYHIKGNVLDVIDDEWDLVIGFPPCTYLSKVSNRHYGHRKDLHQQGYEFAMRIWGAKQAKKVAMAQLAGKLSPDWLLENQDYRSTSAELAGYGVGNSAGARKNDAAPAHIDSTLATEFEILLDLASRAMKGQ